MKVLVVDDDRVLADLVSFTLRRAGYEAVIAGDAASALRRWTEDQPDFIILDVNLPGTADMQDGFAICQRIRSESDVPIILLTERDSAGEHTAAFIAGTAATLPKPFPLDALFNMVQGMLPA